MDLLIYNDINNLYDFFYNNDKFATISIILKNIDSLKNKFSDSFSISKCKKVFSQLVEYEDSQAYESLKLSNLKGTVFHLVSAITSLYEIHPVVENLIIFFYMTKYECCNQEYVEIFFECNLRKYMGFFLKQKIINELFEQDLIPFVIDGLFVLNEAINLWRKYLIDYFYRYHFQYKTLMKEYSETLSVFNLTDFKNKTTINICAGNACGIHFLETKMTCVDKNKYTGMKLLEKMDICNFVECDIMDNIFESVVSKFNLWIAIHACRNLSIRIIEVFQKCAPEYSELYLVPCCNLNKKYYKKSLGDFIYDRIYKFYYNPQNKKDGLKQYHFPAMHFELLCSLCMIHKFKIKTLRDMKSVKNKVIILYK